MAHKLLYGVVLEHRRKAIHVVCTENEMLDSWEVDTITEQMQQRLLSRTGEQAANVVVVHGASRETLRICGEPHAVSRVRAAMFNAAVRWSPLLLD